MQLNAAQTVFCTGAANLAAAANAMGRMGYPAHLIVNVLGEVILAVFSSLSLREVTDLIEKGFNEMYDPDFDTTGLEPEQIEHMNRPGRREEVHALLQTLKEQLNEIEALEAAEESSQYGNDHDAIIFTGQVEDIVGDLKADGC